VSHRKTLEQLVLDGTFLARKDHPLLAGPELPWSAFAALQRKYRAASEPFERRAIALAFERLVRQATAEAEHQLTPSLAEALAKLGPAGSFEQLARFFPWALRHYQGAHAGKPFRLEPFQRDFLAEFWRRRANGRRVYSVGLLGIAKGNGKTPLAAGLGLYALLSEQGAPRGIRDRRLPGAGRARPRLRPHLGRGAPALCLAQARRDHPLPRASRSLQRALLRRAPEPGREPERCSG
jgi:hypothetical protein